METQGVAQKIISALQTFFPEAQGAISSLADGAWKLIIDLDDETFAVGWDPKRDFGLSKVHAESKLHAEPKLHEYDEYYATAVDVVRRLFWIFSPPQQGPIQTRGHSGELCYFSTFQAAYDFAKANRDVWKISFENETRERIRLVRISDQDQFILSQLTDEMIAALRERGDHDLADKLEKLEQEP